MVDIFPNKEIDRLPVTKDLLYANEVIAIVDDSPEVALLLETYLNRQNVEVVTARNAEEFFQLLPQKNIALVFLDIGLPGKSGIEILTELVPNHPDLGIIMVTGTTDVQTAIACIRKGADDYLTKPVSAAEFDHTLRNTLKKRRLAIENRIYQQKLVSANFRMEFLHNLNFKMNTAYLNALELDSVLQTILAGITSEEGLRFNRAFLALFNDEGTTLSGKFGVGPSSREEAQHLWREIKEKNLDLPTMLDTIAEDGINPDTHVNQLARQIKVEATQTDHILIQCCQQKKAINVKKCTFNDVSIPQDFCRMLDVNDFVVVPLFSPSRSLGIILADNYVTGTEITAEDITALEIFANEASLAIEHSHLYRDMNNKIEELEQITEELEENKDMLIEAERYSTIGFISAQLVHAIRNPLTSIGGTARLLLKKTTEEDTRKFLQIMAEETSRIEDTLNNIFQFSDDIVLEPEPTHIAALLRESLALFYTELRKNNIQLELDLEEDHIILNLDAKKIRTVFNQLLRTIIATLPSGGKIIASLQRQDALTIVRLTGAGRKSPASATNLADDPIATAQTYGSGLELTVVEQILDLHKAEFIFRQPSQDEIHILLQFPGNSF
ncbi:MAG: response regulator [Desulfocapsaceae bacterium]|nr:response regulator [Desulfocapsaceae bacterium]